MLVSDPLLLVHIMGPTVICLRTSLLSYAKSTVNRCSVYCGPSQQHDLSVALCWILGSEIVEADAGITIG